MTAQAKPASLITPAFYKSLRGAYIAFDGPNGGGKSTLINSLMVEIRKYEAEQLQAELPDAPAPLDVEMVREPGSTEVGEHLRQLLRFGTTKLAPETNALLFMAARAQLVREKVQPLRERGYCVISDRCVASTYAYQSAEGVSTDWISQMYEGAVPLHMQPDLVVIVDVPIDVGRERVAKANEGVDNFESRSADYHMRVRGAYIHFVRVFSGRALAVDGFQEPRRVLENTIKQVSDFFGNRLV